MIIDKVLDTRGLNCPLPILKAKKALAEMLSGKDEQLKQATDYANGSVRSSTYQDATYLAKFPLAKDWLTATAASS